MQIWDSQHSQSQPPTCCFKHDEFVSRFFFYLAPSTSGCITEHLPLSHIYYLPASYILSLSLHFHISHTKSIHLSNLLPPLYSLLRSPRLRPPNASLLDSGLGGEGCRRRRASKSIDNAVRRGATPRPHVQRTATSGPMMTMMTCEGNY